MLHTCIEGPPGVGKTKLGRILAQIYSALGIIKSNRFVKVRRTDLIGKYLGQTAHKTQEVIDEAEGGVLFIDEAYSLGDNENRDSYSKECIDTLNQNLTEKKKKLIVIIAGYTDQLDKTFFALNEGLRRRFPFRFTIDGYNEKEMTDIFYSKIQKIKWKLHMDLNRNYLDDFFKNNKEKFKNYGGDIETLVMHCKMTHASRIIGKNYAHKKIIIKDDFIKAFYKFNTTKNKLDTNYEYIKKTFYS
jgi:SpoVK/Ycf46/Vps4 family AAA+-type ATPase